MKMRLTLGVAACAFLACSMGAGTKIRSFTPIGNGVTENADVDGMAMLTFSAQQSRTEVQVVLHGLLPNTTYGIKLTSDGGGFSDPIALDTNDAGNGNYHVSVPQDRTGHPSITVYLWDGNTDPDTIDVVTSDEIRATGAAS